MVAASLAGYDGSAGVLVDTNVWFDCIDDASPLHVEAIAARTDLEEQRRDLEEVAERRYASLVASGRSIPWSEMRTYLDVRAAGAKAKRPASRKLAR